MLIIIIGYFLPRLWKYANQDIINNTDSNACIKIFGILYDSDSAPGAYIAHVGGFIVGIIAILINVYKLLYITIAPKIFLIEYMTDLSGISK